MQSQYTRASSPIAFPTLTGLPHEQLYHPRLHHWHSLNWCGLTCCPSVAPPSIDRDHVRVDSDLQKSYDLGAAKRRQLHGRVRPHVIILVLVTTVNTPSKAP